VVVEQQELFLLQEEPKVMFQLFHQYVLLAVVAVAEI
tara:strand:- start:573 stop:683 length:111 start_codon:yes stop_codon:yes gene_type:complete